MEKCHIADLVSLKCEGATMTTATVCCVKRCWLLCTTYSGKKAARTSEDLNGEALPEFFLFHSKNRYVSKEYSFV
jgi:hypothetical protein